MPDYSYLKKRVEEEKNKQLDDDAAQVKKYYDEEDKIVDLFIKRIKANIEQAVYKFYKNGRNDRIIKKRFFYKGLFRKGFLHKECYYEGTMKVVVNKEVNVYNPESISVEICLPNERCLESFIRKVNMKLKKDKIKVKKGAKDNICKNGFYLCIWAEIE